MKKHVIKNKKHWEKFAEKDAIFYIDTDAKNPDDFWQKGETNLQIYILPLLKKYNIKTNIGVDFGCGVGRNTLPLTKHFQTMVGVDISENMLKQALSYAREKNITNVQLIENDEFYSSTKSIDFIYCVNVFQHIEKMEQIEYIFKKLSHKLNGYAYVQFDTRPKNILYLIKKIIPDFLLPKSQRHGIRRTRRSAKKIEEMITKMGFTIIEQQWPNSEHHFFLLKKLR